MDNTCLCYSAPWWHNSIYCNNVVSVYCKVGGASLQHSAVYEEFAICLPGFLPSAPSLSAAGAKEGGFMRLEV